MALRSTLKSIKAMRLTLIAGALLLAALAITRAGYPEHGPAAYAPAILAPQPVGMRFTSPMRCIT